MPVRKRYRISGAAYRKKKTPSGFGRFGFGLFKKILKWPFGLLAAIGGIFKIFKRQRLIRKRKARFFKRVLKLAIKLSIIFLIVGAAGIAGVFIYFSKDIPDPNKIIDRSVAQSTKIYDRTGKTVLYEIHGEERRTVVKLDQISKYLVDATVAIEDQNFYKHHGIDFRGIARAVWKDVINREALEGGSTITQQLVKNSILTSERTFTRKIKEIILAIETEQKFNKDQIIEMYLNQIPYGSNAYGVEAAAQTFFGKPAKDLDISESAMLASLPRATTYYSPYGTHPEALKARYEYVIDQMFKYGYISEKEAGDAKKVEILKKVKKFEENIKVPHFVMYVRQQLVDEFGEEKVEKGGLKVYTTLDYDLQKIAEETVKNGVESNFQKYNASNGALVAVDPKTNQILAMVGSKNYFDVENDGNMNVATSPNRQPGSSFKPFVYATAFKKGYTPDTVLFDLDTDFGKDGSGREYRPDNFNMKFSGPVTMRQALARSLNVPAVKTLYLAGIKDSVQTAQDLGITTLDEPERYGLSFVLGTEGVKLLDLVSAYGVFANEGKRNDQYSILKIEDQDGNVLKEFKDNSRQVLDVEVARNISSILSDNEARTAVFGANSKLYIKDRPVAAKTGTTSDYKDGWTVGYTPSLAVGVWIGNNNSEKMKYAGGSIGAAPIWNDFMTKALAGKPIEEFTKPKPIVTSKAVLNGDYQNKVVVKIDKACGDKLAGEGTPESQIEERTYIEVHSILYYVQKDNPRGDYPKNPAGDPQFANWEGPVLSWAAENAAGVNINPPAEICPARNRENLPSLTVASPFEDQIISDGKVSVRAEASSNFGIDQLDFYFDDALMGAGKNSPYEIFYRIPTDSVEGPHTITVKAYDKIGNSAEKKISVIVSNNSSIYLKPIVGDSFPFVFNAATLLGNARNVIFYYQLDSIYDADMNLVKKPGVKTEIGRAISPVPGENNLYQILWDEDKEYFIPGEYQIFAVLEDNSGNTHRSNVRYLEIK